jgi:hypothetical protein
MTDNINERTCLRCNRPLLYLVESNTHVCIPCKAEYSFPEFRKQKHSVPQKKVQLPLNPPAMRPYERQCGERRIGFYAGLEVNHTVEQTTLPLNTNKSNSKIKRLIVKKRG